MAVRYQDKIKFKIVFAFTVLDFIAWLNHPKGSNFYSVYLFLTLNRPLITWQEEGNRSSSTWLKLSQTYPVKISAVKYNHLTFYLSHKFVQKLQSNILGQISNNFFVNLAVRVHFERKEVQRHACFTRDNSPDEASHKCDNSPAVAK